MTEGIDISSYQGEIDFPKMIAAKPEFVIIRAGKAYSPDKKAEANYAGLVGKVPIGFYWYIFLTCDTVTQADLFANFLAGKTYQIPPTCDIEVAGDAGKVRQFCECLYERVGDVMIYTGPDVWNNRLTGDKSWAKKYHLWLANYDVAYPAIPLPWTTYDIWQYAIKRDPSSYGIKRPPFAAAKLDHDRARDGFITPLAPPPPTLAERVDKLEAWAKTQGYVP